MSRSRVFKKTIFARDQLRKLEPKILPVLLELREQWIHKQLSDDQMAFEYLKIFCELGLQKPLWRGLPGAIKDCLAHWQRGSWNLVLTEKIPAVEEMLDIQIKGGRYVSILFDFDFYHEDRDVFSFFLHDLMHAHHFFNNSEKMRGEIGFYRLIKLSLEQGFFKVLLRDPVFKNELEYLIADMNAYCVHQLKYLRGAIDRWTERHGESSAVYDQLLQLWFFEEQVIKAANHINTPAFHLEDELKLKAYFDAT